MAEQTQPVGAPPGRPRRQRPRRPGPTPQELMRDRLIESRLTPNAISLTGFALNLATRPVRVVILSIGLVFAKGAGLGDFELLAPAVYVLAGLTILTTIQRIVYVRQQLIRASDV